MRNPEYSREYKAIQSDPEFEDKAVDYPTFLAGKVRAELEAERTSDKGSAQERLHHKLAGEVFGELFIVTAPSVYNYLKYRVNRPDDMDDVVQGTYARLYKSMIIFRGDAKITTWLRYATYSELSKYYNPKNKQVLGLGESEDAAGMVDYWSQDRTIDSDPGSFLLDDLEIEEKMKPVIRAIKEIKLSRKKTYAVVLHHALGLKFKRIAEEFGGTEASVKVNSNRGLHAIQGQLAKDNQDQPEAS